MAVKSSGYNKPVKGRPSGVESWYHYVRTSVDNDHLDGDANDIKRNGSMRTENDTRIIDIKCKETNR